MSGLPPPNILSYTGLVSVPSINRTFPPTTDFTDFNVPTVWVDTLHQNAYILVSKALGVADWVFIGGIPGNLETIHTPDGTTVVPSSGNIDFLNGTGFNITGSGSNITFSADAMTITAGTGLTGGGTLNLGGTVTLSLTAPVTVSDGGTGAVSLTGLLTGNGTGAITGTAITEYNVITGGVSSAPNSVAPSATSGVALISQGSSAQPVFGTVAIAGGGTNATSYTQTNGIITYNGTSLVNHTGPQINSSGQFTNSTQPAFLYYQPTVLNSVTGDGTVYTLGTTTALTQLFDNDSNCTTGGTFTAPVTGKYLFNFGVSCVGSESSTNQITLSLTTTSSLYQNSSSNYSNGIGAGNQINISGSIVAKMTAADTATVSVAVYGGATKGVAVNGSSTVITYFSGYLVC